jgi:hypothetical protein
LAWQIARLPRLKHFPSYAQFVGTDGDKPPVPEQTEEQMEAVFDRWYLIMRSADAQRGALTGV